MIKPNDNIIPIKLNDSSQPTDRKMLQQSDIKELLKEAIAKEKGSLLKFWKMTYKVY